MDKDLFQMKMFHVPTAFAEENKFAFVFMKVGELVQNGILTEVFIAPLSNGSLIRLIDSIVTQNRERQIIAINYIKSTEIHMVQCNEDGRFRMIIEHENSLTDLIKNTDSEFSYQLISIENMNEEENNTKQEEVKEEETDDTILDDLDNEKEEPVMDNNTVRLDNGVKKNESQMNAPSLEQPNRVRLGNGRSEVRSSQPTQTETNNRAEQYNTNNRNEFKQRFGNPNRQNRFDNRNQNERPKNNNNNERNENRNGKNQNQKNNKFRPKLAPTTFELVGD